MRVNRPKASSVLMASVLLAGAAVAGISTNAEAASYSYSCGNQPSQVVYGVASTGVYPSAGSNIRSGPSTNCTPLGVGYSSHFVRLDCYVYNTSDGQFWDHVYDYTTGFHGWTREDVLAKVVPAPYTCSPGTV